MRKSLVVSILITLLLITSCVQQSAEAPKSSPSETTLPKKEVSQPTPSESELATTEPLALIVNTADDTQDSNDGKTSLREAINASNKRPGPDTITFDPSVFPPSETIVIELTSPLPSILDGNTTIDASGTQVTVDGSKLPGMTHGFEINSSNNTLKGIRVQNVPGIAVHVIAFNGNLVDYNILDNLIVLNSGYKEGSDEIDPMAIVAHGAGSRTRFNRVINCIVENSPDDGIEIVSSAGGAAENNLILGSIFRNNAEVGIEIDAKAGSSASNNEVTNNIVEGTKGMSGIGIVSAHGGIADGNIIDSNVVVGNNEWGIFIITWGGLGASASANVIINNTIERNNNGGICVNSDEASVVKDNRIIGNTIKDHSQKDKGIGLMVQNSNDNLIYHNNFIQNDCQVADFGKNNWDYNGEGNYWSDYTGIDADEDGIGDTPYKFTKGKGVDNYPLMKPYEQ